MTRMSVLAGATLVALFLNASVVGQDTKNSKAPAQPELKLPPGWTAADMQACIAAATPGEMHKHLAKGLGKWSGKNTMWMAPGAEPVKSECTSNVTSLMGGRYTKCEITGEIPGMGPFNGIGITGFDNVSQKFVSDWIDSQSTGIMVGTGELSKDGKTLTWAFTHNCPITKKPVTSRQIETYTSDNSLTIDMFTIDPKSGKEYQCMRIELSKQ